MAAKSDFTEQEWEAMHKGVSGAGLLVSVSDPGFFDTFKEAGALAKHLAGARKNSSSELLRELAETRGTGFGLRSSRAELESETLEALRAAIAALQAKAPQEVETYRTFVVEVAESVAGAAEGGADAEGAALDRIKSALGGASAA